MQGGGFAGLDGFGGLGSLWSQPQAAVRRQDSRGHHVCSFPGCTETVLCARGKPRWTSTISRHLLVTQNHSEDHAGTSLPSKALVQLSQGLPCSLPTALRHTTALLAAPKSPCRILVTLHVGLVPAMLFPTLSPKTRGVVAQRLQRGSSRGMGCGEEGNPWEQQCKKRWGAEGERELEARSLGVTAAGKAELGEEKGGGESVGKMHQGAGAGGDAVKGKGQRERVLGTGVPLSTSSRSPTASC